MFFDSSLTGGLTMDLQVEGRNFLDASANGKATVATSRRSFIAGWKLCAGAALGLGLAGRSSLAQRAPPGPCVTSACTRCFLPGTRIKTPHGETNIEELRIGDHVLTASGEAKPIKFIGRGKLSRERPGPWKKGEGPVKISRFAIDGKAPHSDLYISPEHAIYIDGVLIPAHNLVNGVTIVADAKPEILSVTLFHIELDTHEAIVAEGLAVESFRLDNQLTHAYWFDNADEYVRLYGSPAEPPAPFAPILRYRSSRQELASHMRRAVAPVCDFRKPIEKVRDRVIDRLARAA
jgi:Hint domain